jgi:hypothetical protein
VWRSVRNTSAQPAELLVICAGDQRKRIEWDPDIAARAHAHGRGRDHDGWIAPAHLLPGASALLRV